MMANYIEKRRAYALESCERYRWLIGSMCFWMAHNIKSHRGELFTELIDKGLGSAGKSRFQRMLHSVLEKGHNSVAYAYKADKDVLRKFTDPSKGNEHLFAVGQQGLRFFTIEEGQYGDKGADTQIVKMLTSGSSEGDGATTQGRRVGQGNVPLYFNSAFVVYANRPIQFNDESDGALRRRRRIVQCEQRFLPVRKPITKSNGEVVDPEPYHFHENPQREWRLKPWAVLSFVVRMVLGCPKIWEYSLTLELPEFLRERSEHILDENDPISNFFDNSLIYEKDQEIEFSTLYSSYFREWWDTNRGNEKILKSKDFQNKVEMYLKETLPRDPESKQLVLKNFALRD